MSNVPIIWLTGIPAAGKTTLARGLAAKLEARSAKCTVLDGDEMRKTLCRDLGFSRTARLENVSRIIELACQLAQNGVWPVVAAVSPYGDARAAARATAEGRGIRFVEVYVSCSLAVAEARDPKQLYRRARAGDLPNFTAVSDPYEEPINPDVHVDTTQLDPAASAERVMTAIAFEPDRATPIVLLSTDPGTARPLGQMVQDLGAFLGQPGEVDGNEHSLFWKQPLEQLAREVASSRGQLPHSTSVEFLRRHAVQFLASGKRMGSSLWGWNDPNSVFALPLIRQAFPRAKFIRVVRHPGTPPEPSGRSEEMQEAILRWAGAPDLSTLTGDAGSIGMAYVWRLQVQWVTRHLDGLSSSSATLVKLEELLRDPQETYDRLCAFLAIRPTRTRTSVRKATAEHDGSPRFVRQKVWSICVEDAVRLQYCLGD